MYNKVSIYSYYHTYFLPAIEGSANTSLCCNNSGTNWTTCQRFPPRKDTSAPRLIKAELYSTVVSAQRSISGIVKELAYTPNRGGFSLRVISSMRLLCVVMNQQSSKTQKAETYDIFFKLYAVTIFRKRNTFLAFQFIAKHDPPVIVRHRPRMRRGNA